MARNTVPGKSDSANSGSKGPGKYSSKGNKGRKLTDKDLKSSGSNRTLFIALGGFTVIAIVAIALIAVFSTTGTGNSANFTPNNQGLLSEGETAPELAGENLNGGGGNFNLEANGDAKLVVFFASWCPHCQNEAPIISELESQSGLQTVMVGVDNQSGDTPQAVRGFVENFDIEAPTIYDPSLAQPFNVTGYPTTYVLDGQNRVVGSNSGEVPQDVLEGWIEEAKAA